MSKLLVVGMIWLLLFAFALIFIDEEFLSNGPDQQSNGSHYQPLPHASDNVMLRVDGEVVDDFWERGVSDTPVLKVAISYSVENLGNVSANVVDVEISLGSAYWATETIYDLQPNHSFTNLALLSIDYDQSRTVLIEARYYNLTASWNYTVTAELPRQFHWSVSKLFITPNEQKVQSTYNQIMGSGIILVHWIAIRDWVGRNIKYAADYETHNNSEYWQLGKETLEAQSGDCEDFAILLCSLLRADGWKAEDVYVVIGQNEADEYHAWVKIRIPMVGWYNIEAQLDGWNTILGDFIALHGYTAIYNFNDQQFVDLNS